jgi:hypothetical protein
LEKKNKVFVGEDTNKGERGKISEIGFQKEEIRSFLHDAEELHRLLSFDTGGRWFQVPEGRQI